MKSNVGPEAPIKTYLYKHKKSLTLLAVLFAANIALQTLAPEALSRFIDASERGDVFGQVVLTILLYLAVIVLQTIASLFLNYLSQAAGYHITDDYRKDVMAHFLKIGMAWQNRWKSGEMMTRLDEDVNGMFQYYYILLFKLTGSAVLLICVLTVLAFRSGILCAALFLLSIIAILVFKRIQDKGVAKYVRSAKAAAEFNGAMKEMIDNAVEIRAFDAEEYSARTMLTAMQKRYHENFPAFLMYGNLWSASTIMEAFIVASVLAVGVYLWDGGLATIGTVYLIYTYTMLVYEGSLQNFRNYMGELQGARAGMIRVKELMDIPADMRQGNKMLGEGGITLEVRNLSFAYSNGENVLHDVSYRTAAGERLGIMGETGCGKSTLVGLIARLYEFEHGEILLNGIDIRELDAVNLRENAAYCTQNVQLLHGTLRDNITLYDKRYTDSAIDEAVEKLKLTEWFAQFPDGLNTHLAMGESNLSAGEAQLVTLIRLALKKPKLVLLDEITSRLDAATERRVAAAIEALCQGRTVIMIAHNPSAVSWMDRILYMREGTLYEN